jgi:chromosome segregation ATPase
VIEKALHRGVFLHVLKHQLESIEKQRNDLNSSYAVIQALEMNMELTKVYETKFAALTAKLDNANDQRYSESANRERHEQVIISLTKEIEDSKISKSKISIKHKEELDALRAENVNLSCLKASKSKVDAERIARLQTEMDNLREEYENVCRSKAYLDRKVEAQQNTIDNGMILHSLLAGEARHTPITSEKMVLTNEHPINPKNVQHIPAVASAIDQERNNQDRIDQDLLFSIQMALTSSPFDIPSVLDVLNVHPGVGCLSKLKTRIRKVRSISL